MADMIKLAMSIEDMKEYEPLPAGAYPAELREAEIRYTDKTPTGFLYTVFRIDPADFPADYDVSNAPEGVNVVYARVRIPDPSNNRTVAPFKNFLRALNVDPAGDSFDPSAWIGTQTKVLLSKNEYQGALVNNVDAVMALSGV